MEQLTRRVAIVFRIARIKRIATIERSRKRRRSERFEFRKHVFVLIVIGIVRARRIGHDIEKPLCIIGIRNHQERLFAIANFLQQSAGRIATCAVAFEIVLRLGRQLDKFNVVCVKRLENSFRLASQK